MRLNPPEILRRGRSSKSSQDSSDSDGIDHIQAIMSDAILSLAALNIVETNDCEICPVPARATGPIVSWSHLEKTLHPITLDGKAASLVIDIEPYEANCVAVVSMAPDTPNPKDLLDAFEKRVKSDLILTLPVEQKISRPASAAIYLCLKDLAHPSSVAAITPLQVTRRQPVFSGVKAPREGAVETYGGIIFQDGSYAEIFIRTEGVLMLYKNTCAFRTYQDGQQLGAGKLKPVDDFSEKFDEYTAPPPPPLTGYSAEKIRACQDYTQVYGLPAIDYSIEEDRAVLKPGSSQRLGGSPYAEEETKWPVCPGCNRPLLFVAQFHDHFSLHKGNPPIVQIFGCRMEDECSASGMSHVRVWEDWSDELIAAIPDAPEPVGAWKLNVVARYREASKDHDRSKPPIGVPDEPEDGRPDDLWHICGLNPRSPKRPVMTYGGPCLDYQSQASLGISILSEGGTRFDFMTTRNLITFMPDEIPVPYYLGYQDYPVSVARLDGPVMILGAYWSCD